MINKVIRELDSKNQISLRKDLLELAGIKCKTRKVAIVEYDEGKITLRRLDCLQGCKVIACVSMDEKGRIIIPQEIRGKTTKFQMYYLDGDLILEEAH